MNCQKQNRNGGRSKEADSAKTMNRQSYKILCIIFRRADAGIKKDAEPCDRMEFRETL